MQEGKYVGKAPIARFGYGELFIILQRETLIKKY